MNGSRLPTAWIVGLLATGLVTWIVAFVARRRVRPVDVLLRYADRPPILMSHLTAFRLERSVRSWVKLMACVLIADLLFAKLLPMTAVTYIGLLAMVGIVISTAYGLMVAAAIRCKSCGRRMLLESHERPPYPPPRMQGNVLRAGVFQCMYCGQRYVFRNDAVASAVG